MPDSPSNLEPALQVENLHKRFGELHILKGVSLSVAHGERVALLGSNGSGKSTLLRSSLRLIEPDEGEVRVLGKSVRGLSFRKLRAVRSSVGFIFQKHNLVPRLSALSNVIHGTQGRSGCPGSWFQMFASQKTRQDALDCLSEVALEHVAGRYVHNLSGGQSQRVAIARALMQNPEMIFADEPVASLDPEAGLQVMELLSRLATQKKISLLFTTHHLEHALQYSDRVIGLIKGKIELSEQTKDLSLSDLRGFYE